MNQQQDDKHTLREPQVLAIIGVEKDRGIRLWSAVVWIAVGVVVVDIVFEASRLFSKW